MFQKTILSIYERTGHFSHAYKREGYEVIQVDSAIDGKDARTIPFQPGLNVHGIIACPPCTYFSKANTRANFEKNKTEALSLLDVIFRMIVLYRPNWYVIENPSESRIRQFIGAPTQIIRLSDYGYPCLKGTGLWGNFHKVLPAMKPKEYCKNFDRIPHNLRSSTPHLLGEYFYKSNP